MIYTGDKLIEIWSKEDIEYVASKRNITLTPEQLDTTMINIMKYHTCEIGISWDVIDSCIDITLEMGVSPKNVIDAAITRKSEVEQRIYSYGKQYK